MLCVSIKMHVSKKMLELVTKNCFHQCAGSILEAVTFELL